jgi:hypothetical protein
MGYWQVLRAFVGGALVTFAQAQGAAGQSAPATVRDFHDYASVYAQIHWSVDTSGPLIATCPSGVTKGRTLDEIGRKLVRIGDLTAVVPTRMVTIHSHFMDPPNLYDGLPMEAKVLYLLTLLKDDQWTKITGDGLTLGDCQGDQIAVMQSILPNPFTTVAATLTGPNSLDLHPDNSSQLTDQERSQVKLRIARSLEISIGLNSGGLTNASVRDGIRTGSTVPIFMPGDGNEYGQQIQVAASITNYLANPGQPLILDFSNVVQGKLDTILKLWLRK